MNRIVYLLAMLTILTTLVSCDNYETYGEKKEKERKAIANFIKDEGIVVISEDDFEDQGCTTDTAANEFVLFDKSGVYMQICREGCGTKIEEDKQVNILCRFVEYDIIDTLYLAYNITTPSTYDKMTVIKSGSDYTASFVFGAMYNVHGSSVPTGWLVPLDYILLGRQTSEDEEIAKVRLIVPHSQGTTTAQSSVYPCYYEITYQRER